MIKFRQGSGRWSGPVEVFHFNADTEDGPVHCAISLEAFAKLTRSNLNEESSDATFCAAEAIVFKLAEQKFLDRGLNARGALTISEADVLQSRVA